jgi:hypothetical protein
LEQGAWQRLLHNVALAAQRSVVTKPWQAARPNMLSLVLLAQSLQVVRTATLSLLLAVEAAVVAAVDPWWLRTPRPTMPSLEAVVPGVVVAAVAGEAVGLGPC